MAKKNLFSKAKAKGATSSPKPQKDEVVIKDPVFHMNLSRLAEINQQIDALNGESKILSGMVKEESIKAFTDKFNSDGKYPGSFLLKATGMKNSPDASLMVIPTDRYLKIGEDRYEELVETYGEDIAEENTTYTMDSKLIEKYGEVISDLIYGSKKIADDDKEKLIEAVTSYTVKKGTITKLNEFGGTVQEMIEEVKPVFQMKNIKLEEE